MYAHQTDKYIYKSLVSSLKVARKINVKLQQFSTAQSD